jgi:hypothetical protein
LQIAAQLSQVTRSGIVEDSGAEQVKSQSGFGIGSPKVLLVDSNRWDLGARLAIGLTSAGCSVSAVCPSSGHPFSVTRAVKHIFPYKAFNPIGSLRDAIERFDPDIVIPSCERSVEHLHELYAQALHPGFGNQSIVRIIERSLGNPSGYRVVTSRYDLLTAAAEFGVRIPDTARISSSADLDLWREQSSRKCVIKADGTWGGVGVCMLSETESSEKAWLTITKTSRLVRALKRMIVNRDSFYLRAWLNRVERAIIAQKFIEGRPANCTVFSWQGKVLALIAVEAVRTERNTGPASIVHLIRNAEIETAAERIASKLGLSGFFGLDFIIERETGLAYLIEMNPRLTPPCYLRFEKGRDLVGALWASLSGQPLPDNVPVTNSEMIAYSPRTMELSDTPKNCFYPRPDGEPELARELESPFPDRTILYRLLQRFDRKPVNSASA